MKDRITAEMAHHYFFSAIETADQIDVSTEEGHALYLEAEKALKKQIPLPLERKCTDGTGFCDNCGQVVKLYDKYCSYCGQRLDS